jgi:hypothetical protein
MRGRYFALAVAVFLIPGVSQDVLMESDTDDEVLLKVENTGEDAKTIIKVLGTSSDVGIDVGGGVNIGIQAEGVNYGLKGIATDYYGWGVWAEGNIEGIRASGNTGLAAEGLYTGVSAYAGEENGTGIYAAAWGDYSYAGFFDGNVAVTGDCDPCSPSDAVFKKNVQPLSGGLAKVLALKPKVYEMKVAEFKDRISLGKGGSKFGFVAQDLELAVPEVVHPMKVRARLTLEEQRNRVTKPPLEFKAANYKDLIPVLVGAIQEQQVLIEALQAEVEALKR